MTGEFATTGLHARRDGNVLIVTVDPVKGSFPGMLTRRALQLELPGDWPPTRVEANGKELHYTSQSGNKGWSFIGNTLTTTVLTSAFTTNRGVTIVIKRDPAWVASSDLLDGFAGKMVTLRRTYDDTNSIWPTGDLVVAMQTGNRISYHPENARTEILKLPSLVAHAMTALNGI